MIMVSTKYTQMTWNAILNSWVLKKAVMQTMEVGVYSSRNRQSGIRQIGTRFMLEFSIRTI